MANYPKQTTPATAADSVNPADSANQAGANQTSANQVVASPSFPELEQRVLGFWEQDNTFRDSIAARQDAPEWVFNDGPPFANGLPHW